MARSSEIAKKHFDQLKGSTRAQDLFTDNVEQDLENFFDARKKAAAGKAAAENQARLTQLYNQEKDALEAAGKLSRGKTLDGYHMLKMKYRKLGWGG